MGRHETRPKLNMSQVSPPTLGVEDPSPADSLRYAAPVRRGELMSLQEPPFWDPQIEHLDFFRGLVERAPEIRKEVIELAQSVDGLHDYPKYPIEGGRALYENHWTAAPLSRFEGEFISLKQDHQMAALVDQLTAAARQKCPVFTAFIAGWEADNHLANAFISRLKPGSIINPHRGWTRDWLRVHLGIACDPQCRITVGSETRTWQEGRLLAFKDGGPYLHSVRHEGTVDRIILSMDIRLNFLRGLLRAE